MTHTFPNPASAFTAGAACPRSGRMWNTGRGIVALGFAEALVWRRDR